MATQDEPLLAATQQLRTATETGFTELAGELKALRSELGRREQSGPIAVLVRTLAPEPYELLQEIPVVVQPTEDGFLATFFDASLGMSGDTAEEAVDNLKALVVDVFESLLRDEGRLGPQPIRQLAVLRAFLRRRD